MKALKYLNTLFLMILLTTAHAQTGPYFAFSVDQLKVDTTNAATKPLVGDFRFGYETGDHQFELAYMSSISDDSLNQLTVDIPSVTSVFYRYLPYQSSSVKVNLILGYSQVEVESMFPGIPNETEQFEGASYGISFEEALTSIPNLKIKFDWIQLYRGSDLNLTVIGLGARYVF